MAHEPIDSAQALKALGNPIRLRILRQIAAQHELPCGDLEDTLPISKPTISYHTKILRQAGIIDVHKNGRYYSFSLRREVLGELAEVLHTFTSDPSPMGRKQPRSRRGAASAPAQEAPRKPTADDGVRPSPPPLLTW